MNRHWVWAGVLAALAGGVFFAGIRWGVPSSETNALYFSGADAIGRRVEALEAHPVEEAGRGMGADLARDPGEAARKAPRSWYNPIRTFHPDEYFVLKSLVSMSPSRGDFDPHQYTVGGAYLYPVGGLIFLLSKLGAITAVPDISFYFHHPERIAAFYVAGRAVTAASAVGCVLLTFFLSLAIHPGRRRAFAAAVLFLFAPLTVLNAHFMYVDIPGLFWILAALLAGCRLVERPSPGTAALCGLFAGLAVGTKFSFAPAALIPLGAAALGRPGLRRWAVCAAAAAAAGTTVFLATNPYVLLAWPDVRTDLGQHTGVGFSPGFYLLGLVAGLGAPAAFLCLSGPFLAACVSRRDAVVVRRRHALLGLWGLGFLLFVALFSKHFARYVIPAVPALAVLGVGAWRALGARGGKAGRTFAAAVVIAVCAWTIAAGLAYEGLFLRRNVRTEAGIWMREHIPPGSRVGVTEVPWQFQMPPFDYERLAPVVTGYDVGAALAAAPEWFLVSSFQAPVAPYPVNIEVEKPAFWREFEAAGVYRTAMVWTDAPRFAGIAFGPPVAPEDLIYLHPTVMLLRRAGRAGDL